ncbi:transporter substrate-binding domain-containing protein [Cupriavidus sp. 2TAF22]|uniref:ATP-binding protein n=1 Tax=unclassified Cupriavidus TaxID=2640874 RepID=UPI003F918036
MSKTWTSREAWQGWLVHLALLLFCAGALPAGAGQASPVAAASAPVVIRIGIVKQGLPPFLFARGPQPSGYGIDMLREALGGATTRFTEREYPDIPALIAATCKGEIDILISMAKTDARKNCLIYSEPYFNGDTVVVGRRADQVAGTLSPGSTGARFAVEPGFYMEGVVRARYPRATLVPAGDVTDGLRAVATGRADFYSALQPVAEYTLARREFDTLSVVNTYREPGSEVYFAFPPASTAFRAQVNAGLARISSERRLALLARWINARLVQQEPAEQFFLAPEERAFLSALPPLRVGFDVGLAPYSYLDESGRPSGIALDYLGYLGEALGLRFQRVPSASFGKTVEAMHSGGLDLMAVAAPHDSGLRALPVSRPYAAFPVVIVGRQSAPAIGHLKDIEGLRVVVTAAGGVGDMVRTEVPGARLSTAASVHAALDSVASGNADVYVDDLASADVELQRSFAGKLRVIGSGERLLDIGFAVSPALSARLLPLVNRALSALPDQRRLDIQQRYMAASYVLEPSWRQILERAGLPFAALLCVVAILLRSQYLLRREVAGRREVERKVSVQQRFQSTLIDAVPVPLAVMDKQGRYLAVNAAFASLLDVKQEDLVGRLQNEAEVWGAEISATLDRAIREALLAGEMRHIALDFQGTAGHARHFICWLQPFAPNEADAGGIICSAVEVSEIRLAELKARKAEARLIDVTRHLPATVFQMRQAQGEDFAFVWVSGNTQELFGLDAEEIVADTARVRACIHPEHAGPLREAVTRAGEILQPVNHEVRLLGRGGLQWARLHAVPRREDDGSTLWNGYWTDTTEEHARAAALGSARDTAEAASRAKDNFLAMMSHEIRTPMSGVLGLVELLGHTELSREQASTVGMIEDSAGALLQILDDILDYSKIEAGRIDIEWLPLDLRELCDNALGLLATRAHDKGLLMRLDVSEDVAAVVLGDSVRLRQIFFNLLSNAIKFTERGTVSFAVEVAGERNGAQTIVCRISDTGVGIAPDQRARLFEPFMQADSSTTRRFGGTGLGLSICRRLLVLMHGEITLESEPGVGTQVEVRLTLPVREKAYADRPLAGRRAAIRVSDAGVAHALAHLLRAAGADADNGADNSADSGPDSDPDSGPDSDPVSGAQPTGRQARAGFDLLFLDDGAPLPVQAGAAAPAVIHITDKPKLAGYRLTRGDVRLSVNPLTWRGLKAASLAAPGGSAARGAERATTGPAGVPALSREAALAQGRLILVAEDHPTNRILLQRQLKVLGYASDAVVDGGQALAALGETDYALLITDCHMPVMNGYELAAQVRAREAARAGEAGKGRPHLPIVAITASTEAAEMQRCLDAGMDECLFKPAQLHILQACLERWIRPASLSGTATQQE